MIIIVTLNYNQNDYTIKCVASILRSKYEDYKLLIIDNGSDSKNYKKLKKSLPKDDRLILERIPDNRGYVGGINYGLKYGAQFNPDYYLIMNNDTIIEEKAINELVKSCEYYNDKAIITGKVYHYDEPNKIQDIGYIFEKEKTLQFKRIGLNEIDEGQFDQVAERDMLDDVFWLFPFKLYKEIGGYSTYFWFNAEQADFALRAKKNGYKLIFNPRAKLWHKGSVSIGGRDLNPKLAYYHIQSSLILRYLHLKKIHFINYFFSILGSTLRTTIKDLVLRIRGNKSLKTYAKAKRKGLYYFLRWVLIRNVNNGEIPLN